MRACGMWHILLWYVTCNASHPLISAASLQDAADMLEQRTAGRQYKLWADSSWLLGSGEAESVRALYTMYVADEEAEVIHL